VTEVGSVGGDNSQSGQSGSGPSSTNTSLLNVESFARGIRGGTVGETCEDPLTLSNLMELGFLREESERAIESLKATTSNPSLEAAVEFILGNQSQVSSTGESRKNDENNILL